MRFKQHITLSITCLLFQSASWAETCQVEAFFTPQDSIQQVITQHLRQAKRSAHLSLFGITNQALVNELIKLKEKGIDVQLCVDKRQSYTQGSQIGRLIQAGIPVIIKKTGVLEHHKYVVIDGQKVIMGSWNWSSSAERQDNSDVILTGCSGVIQQFENNFHMIRKRDSDGQ